MEWLRRKLGVPAAPPTRLTEVLNTATSELLSQPDWAANMEIVDLVGHCGWFA